MVSTERPTNIEHLSFFDCIATNIFQQQKEEEHVLRAAILQRK